MDNTEYVLSLSYGKDSLAAIYVAIEILKWRIGRIIHAEVWATDTIPADLPPMVEFKGIADETIERRWGIKVEHLCAMRNGEKLTYEKLFYHVPKRKPGGKFDPASSAGFPYQKGAWCNDRLKTSPLDGVSHGGGVTGFPYQCGPWCNTKLKVRAMQFTPPCGFPFTIGSWCKKLKDGSYPRLPDPQRKLVYQRPQTEMFSSGSLERGAKTNIVQYLGIAADEPERIARHDKPGFKMPLVEAGWTEAMCRKWCEENGLLSPIYTTATRGGCWFCHNQGIDQLRLLRQNYPDLWALLMKWDADSPTTFKADGHTVHDFDRRFQAESLGLIPRDRTFRWKMLDTADVRRAIAQDNILKMLEVT